MEAAEAVVVLRQEYRQIRNRSHCEDRATFDRLVGEWLDKKGLSKASPENWVLAAKKVPILCRRCCGTGMFVTSTVNGKPTGPGGICYRCSGKSWQNDGDARRNFGADRHVRIF